MTSPQSQSDGAQNGGARPRAALIMRSMNEQPYTDRALAGLARQTFQDYVLYNVDSGSTDGTLEAVQRFNRDPGRVIQIAPEDYVPGAVLNDMIARTREPIVAFLNADAVPCDARWFEKLLAPILAGEADAAMSRQIPRDSARFVVKYDMQRAYDSKNLKGNDSDLFSAVACAFKRELWEETKFYTEGYAEDLAWAKQCKARGARFLLVDDSVVEHSHNYTLEGLYKKRYRHGIAYAYIHGARPAFAKQCFAWGREVVRDLFFAMKSLRPGVIPYNVLYRTLIHAAYHAGMREGVRRKARQP